MKQRNTSKISPSRTAPMKHKKYICFVNTINHKFFTITQYLYLIIQTLEIYALENISFILNCQVWISNHSQLPMFIPNQRKKKNTSTRGNDNEQWPGSLDQTTCCPLVSSGPWIPQYKRRSLFNSKNSTSLFISKHTYHEGMHELLLTCSSEK